MYKIIGGDQKEYGPISAEDSRRWIEEGRFNGSSLAWGEGKTEWQPLSAFPEFADVLAAKTGAGTLPPPPGLAAPPLDAGLWSAQVLARQPELHIGQCLAQSWNLFTANFGLFFGATLLIWLISTVCALIPFPLGIVYWV